MLKQFSSSRLRSQRSFRFFAGVLQNQPQIMRQETFNATLTSCGMYFALYTAAVIAGLS
jgi:hypothetical protein